MSLPRGRRCARRMTATRLPATRTSAVRITWSHARTGGLCAQSTQSGSPGAGTRERDNACGDVGLPNTAAYTTVTTTARRRDGPRACIVGIDSVLPALVVHTPP
jgi:hypothetical protein